MSSKVTDLDITIARNLKRFREEAKLSQPHVASFLGMTYQSYQKMEGGRVSFRASSIGKLCSLYGVQYEDLVRDDNDTLIDPRTVALVSMVRKMNEDQIMQLHEQAVRIKYEGVSDE